jgi:beta-glucosidase
LDNFEWAEGFGPRFGLYAVDYDKDFARTPRGSADVYADIIKEGLSEALWEQTKGPF